MDSLSRLLGTRAIEVPVNVGNDVDGVQMSILVVVFNPLSPESSTKMWSEFDELKVKVKESIDKKSKEKSEEFKIPNEITFLLERTVVSLRFKESKDVMKPGVSFNWDSLDDRLRRDIWQAIEDYAYPKLNA